MLVLLLFPIPSSLYDSSQIPTPTLNEIVVDGVVYNHIQGSDELNHKSANNGDGITVDLFNDYDMR
jgi:hypothetical protein